MTQRALFIYIIDDITSKTIDINTNYNNEIISRYFDLVFWDIRGLKKSWYTQNKQLFNNISEKSIVQFKHLSEIEAEIKNTIGHLTVVLFSGKLAYWNRSFFGLIERYGIPYFFRRNKSSFFASSSQNKMASKRNMSNPINKMINSMYHVFLNSGILRIGLRGPDILFLGTRHDKQHINLPFKESNIVYTHTKDYDHFRMVNVSQESKSDFILFIDQYIPFHPETRNMGIAPDVFYKNILEKLNILSNDLQKEVLIAVHPSSDINQLLMYLPEQMLVIGKTHELINRCNFVITINSSTVLSAYLAQKPVVLITMHELLPESFDLATKDLEKHFLTESIDISDLQFLQKVKKVLSDYRWNESVYNEYIKHKGTLQKMEFEIICEKIQISMNATGEFNKFDIVER
jgi:hypothetical protein